MRRSLAALLVLLLATVAFAGCNLGPARGDSTTSEPTVTPALVPNQTATATPTTAASPPPGIDRDGSVDPETLASAHEAAIGERSFAFTKAGRVLSVDGAVRQLHYRYAVENGSMHVRVLEDGRIAGESYTADSQWFNGEYDRSTDRWNVTVREAGSSDPARSLTGELVAYLGDDAHDVSAVNRNGTTYYRVFYREPPEELPHALRHYTTNVTNFTATAYVRPDGLFRSVAVSFRNWNVDDSDVVDFRMRVQDVGTATVTEPAWVRDARRNGTAIRSPRDPANTSGSSDGPGPTTELDLTPIAAGSSTETD